MKNMTERKHDKCEEPVAQHAAMADDEARFRGAIIHAGGTATSDDVVFAEEGDMVLLGARTLEGLNLRIDAVRKRLVDAGPIVAASAA